MATHWPTKGGVNFVGEYQVSGHTFILPRQTGAGTPSTRTVDLEFLSNEVTIINESSTNPLEVEFEDSTTGTTVKRSVHLTKGSHTFKIKCKKIKFVVAHSSQYYSAVIACTGIPASDYMPPNFNVLGS